MVNVKCDFTAQEVMAKLRDVVYDAERLTFRCGVVLFHGQKTSASVIHKSIPIWWCALHECVFDGYIRCVHKNVEGLRLVWWLYDPGM